MREIAKNILFYIGITGCGIEIRDNSNMISGDSTTSNASSSDAASEVDQIEDSTSSESDGSTTGEFLFDLGDNVGDGTDISCVNMDFLFIVDDSGSMADNQIKLINSFGVFIDGLEILKMNHALDNFHIGVITTDAYQYNSEDCEVLGGLVVSTYDNSCGPYADGYNFFTKNDDIYESFSCSAKVGANGNGTEKPLNALIDAIDYWLGLEGHCNEKFFRSDAILTVIIITDEDDSSEQQNIQDIIDHVVWLKNGDPNAVIMTGIIPHNETLTAECKSDRLTEFIEYFPNHYIENICDESSGTYGLFFENTIEQIINSCMLYEPQG